MKDIFDDLKTQSIALFQILTSFKYYMHIGMDIYIYDPILGWGWMNGRELNWRGHMDFVGYLVRNNCLFSVNYVINKH